VVTGEDDPWRKKSLPESDQSTFNRFTDDQTHKDASARIRALERMSDVPDYCPSKHDYELWEIIWALEFDHSHAKDPAEKAELALEIGWHRKKLQDPREPEAVAWWEDYAVWRNIWGFQYELTKESDPEKRADYIEEIVRQKAKLHDQREPPPLERWHWSLPAGRSMTRKEFQKALEQVQRYAEHCAYLRKQE
jgi:hypothetical protein